MYRRHKVTVAVLFLLTSFLSFKLKADYNNIAEEAIAVVSIALAVYIGAASVLLGSPFAQRLKEHRDDLIRTKTSLGVLAEYLRVAGKFGLATIIVSTLFAVNLNVQPITNYLETVGLDENMLTQTLNVFESITCGMFAVNIFFIWMILIFLINSLTKSV